LTIKCLFLTPLVPESTFMQRFLYSSVLPLKECSKVRNSSVSFPSSTQLPELLCVHGIFGDAKEFVPVLRYFRQQHRLRARTFHLLAHGKKRGPSFASIQVEALIEDMASFLQAREQEGRPYYLMGHSLGGILSLTLAGQLSLPHLQGVIALNAAYDDAYILSPWRHLSRPLRVWAKGTPYLRHYLYGSRLPNAKPWHYWRIRKQGKRLLETLQKHLPQIRVPVLLTHSPYDFSIPPEQIQKLESVLREGQCPSVEVITLPNCGHMVFPASAAMPTVLGQLEQFMGVGALPLPVESEPHLGSSASESI
jgi:pimeloyl-ACP methyl ester carboxylesterase